MGRPRIPDEVKAARGTLQPCRAQGDMDGAVLLAECKPPQYLRGAAKKFFASTANTLICWGLMTEADIDIIAVYAQALAEWVDCVRDIEKNGRFTTVTNDKGGVSILPNPHLQLRDKNAETILKIAKEYGLTAMSRRQLASAMSVQKKKDDFAEFEEV